MNRIYAIILLISTLISFSGCNDWLDVRPESEVVLEDYWQNENQVNQVMASCYRSLIEEDVISRFMVWGELRSDNVVEGVGMDPVMKQILSIDITPANGFSGWGAFYRTINYCNNFLFYAPEVVRLDPNFTDSKYASMKAEVLTIRALCYFYLVRTFKEVPWIGEPSIDDTQEYKIVKSDEEFLIEKILDDLTTALLSARTKFDDEEYNKGRITRSAVLALLADVYLWKEDYQSCVNTCDLLLDNTEFGLELVDGENVISEVFYTGNSSESIFELQFDRDVVNNVQVSRLYGGQGLISGQWSFPYILTDGQYRIFDIQEGNISESEEDLRQLDFLFFNGSKNYVFKYAGYSRQENAVTGSNTYFYRSNSPNWIVYRLSDVMLMKAEAIVQINQDLKSAFDLVNTVYIRSNPEEELSGGLDFTNYNSKQAMVELVLRERQRELMFEGKRWFDLMRLARRADSPAPLLGYIAKKGGSGQISKLSVMNALYMPIHADELKTNSALEQNEYYQLLADGNNN